MVYSLKFNRVFVMGILREYTLREYESILLIYKEGVLGVSLNTLKTYRIQLCIRSTRSMISNVLVNPDLGTFNYRHTPSGGETCTHDKRDLINDVQYMYAVPSKSKKSLINFFWNYSCGNLCFIWALNLFLLNNSWPSSEKEKFESYSIWVITRKMRKNVKKNPWLHRSRL